MDYTPIKNIEAEQAVLGGLLLEKTHHEYIDIILPEYFYKMDHQEIFKVIKELWTSKSNIDILTVSAKFGTDKVVYISNLPGKVGSSLHLQDHLALIVEYYLRRKIITECIKIQGDAYNRSEDIEDIIDNIVNFSRVVNSVIHKKIDAKTFQEISESCVRQVKERKVNVERNISNSHSLPVGKLHKVTGGFKNGELIIIAARPSMGKTAFALKCALHLAERKVRVRFISIEMTGELLIDRILIGESGVDTDKYRNGELDNMELHLINEAKEKFNSVDFEIIDKGSITVDEIYNSVKMDIPDILFIDYIQLISTKGKTENRTQEIGAISRKLKAIAKDFKIPVVALSQLNRGVESRGDKRPMLSDLRESGDLEQDADVVMFLYRDAYYSADAVGNVMEIRVAKNRNGKTGYVECGHNDNFTDFFDIKEF